MKVTIETDFVECSVETQPDYPCANMSEAAQVAELVRLAMAGVGFHSETIANYVYDPSREADMANRQEEAEAE